MVPENIHDFFVASCSVAGALIGLLFVAISVASERLARAEAGTQLHRMRAAAALTAFTNALAVSLFALIPGHKIGPASVSVAIGGILFVAAALLSLIRQREVSRPALRDLLIPAGMLVAFVVQLLSGVQVSVQQNDPGAVNTIAVVVSAFFLAGIARAYELIGGPSIGLRQEVTAIVRSHQQGAADSADDNSP
ncbi:MAG: hypothetical protein ACLPKI_11055 [Streptosporangiaceae bacterium]